MVVKFLEHVHFMTYDPTALLDIFKAPRIVMLHNYSKEYLYVHNIIVLLGLYSPLSISATAV